MQRRKMGPGRRNRLPHLAVLVGLLMGLLASFMICRGRLLASLMVCRGGLLDRSKVCRVGLLDRSMVCRVGGAGGFACQNLPAILLMPGPPPSACRTRRRT